MSKHFTVTQRFCKVKNANFNQNNRQDLENFSLSVIVHAHLVQQLEVIGAEFIASTIALFILGTIFSRKSDTIKS